LDTSDAVYNEGKHRWSFPNGSALYFRHLQNDQALADYQGSEYQFIGIDEVTDLTERQYRFLFSRLTRLEGVTIPLRVRSASNPTGRGRDWIAGVLLARSSEGVYYVDHVERFRGSSLTLQRRIRGVAEADGRDVPIRIEQEPGGSAAHLISILRRDLLREFDVRGVKSTGSKETRAAPIAARAEAGEVKLVRGPWNQDFIDELAELPAKDVHDDQVDALSGAFDFLAVKGSTAPPVPGGSKGQSYWRE